MHRITILTLLVVLHFASAKAYGGRAWSSSDSWYDPPTDVMKFDRGGLPEVNRARIHEVIDSQQKQAIELLKDASCILLSDENAKALLGLNLPEHKGDRFYLVRAVRLHPTGGSYSVKELGNEILVRHDCLGRSPLPMKRDALVLQLKTQPKKVFVTCGMAE